MNEKQMKSDNIMIPIAIVIAGIFIAGAIFFGDNSGSSNTASNKQTDQTAPQTTSSMENIAPITSLDHIRGNPDALVKIIEYSDYECPFCKRFHSTMKRAMNEYGKSGKVAWIYRQFPLDQLHPKNGRTVASASECIAELAGNEAFWKFSDRFFELTPSNDNTDLTIILPQIYSEIGVDQGKVEACISSGKYDQHIQDNIDNAILTGGRGTPWSIVIAPNGQKFPLSGAQPYNSVKQLIEIALKAK